MYMDLDIKKRAEDIYIDCKMVVLNAILEAILINKKTTVF